MLISFLKKNSIIQVARAEKWNSKLKYPLATRSMWAWASESDPLSSIIFVDVKIVFDYNIRDMIYANDDANMVRTMLGKREIYPWDHNQLHYHQGSLNPWT